MKILWVLAVSLALVSCGQTTKKTLKAKAASCGTTPCVLLNWVQGVVPSGAPAVTANNVYRGTTSGSETLLTSLTSPSTSYADTSVVVGNTYYYEVTALNPLESGKSSEAVAALLAPNAPSGLTTTPQ
jgi:hypothetical protein